MSETVEQLTIQKLPLEELHRQHGATFAERDGWLLPSAYGDARAEYEAVRGAQGAGLIDLSARGRIEVGGAEAVQFLNGLITNDVKTLAAGAWIHAAFPNVQGRLLASVRVARPAAEVSFLIDTEPATHQKVFKSLERFTLAGDFRVKDVTAETAQFSLRGARAGACIESVFGDETLAQNGQRESAPFVAVVAFVAFIIGRESHQMTILRATHTGEDVFDLVCGRDAAFDLWNALTEAGARPVGYDAFEVLRVEAGEPRYGVDVSETNVVLEAGQEDETVSYTKGCYIGQEIIARIHWRGHVAKRLAGLVFAEDEQELDATGAKVRSPDGREIGRITSTVFSPQLGRRIALAILKYDYLQPGTKVSVVVGEEELAAQVSSLPFTRGSWHKAPAPVDGNNNADDGETTS
ncbi:MAG TPA: aminomethyltransferase family protein [Pyrinomonadaceae bacterium]|jgi:folate-binding protein YgfZ|nr:aminomethyltransferase family protein [Pyrinomonadaceae bacterium]